MEQFSNVLENIKYDFNDWIDYTFYNKEGGCGRKGSPSKRRRCRRKKKHKKLSKRYNVPLNINNEQSHNIVLRHDDLYGSFGAKDNLSNAIEKTKKHWNKSGLIEKRNYKQWFYNLDDPTYINKTDKHDTATQNNVIAKANYESKKTELDNIENIKQEATGLYDKYYKKLYVKSRSIGPDIAGFQNINEGFDSAITYKNDTPVDVFSKPIYDGHLNADLEKCHQTFVNTNATDDGQLIDKYRLNEEDYKNNLNAGVLSYGNNTMNNNGDAISDNFGKCVDVCRSIKHLNTNFPYATAQGNGITATSLGKFCINTMNQNQLFIQSQVNKIDSDIGVVSNLHTKTIENSIDLSNIALDFKKKSLVEDKYKITDIIEQNDVLDDILLEDGKNHLVFDKTNSDYRGQSNQFNFYNSNIFIHIYLLLVMIYSVMILMDSSYKLTGKIMFIVFLALFPFIAFLIEKYSFVFFKQLYDYVFRYVYAQDDY